MPGKKNCNSCKYYTGMSGPECWNPEYTKLSVINGRPESMYPPTLRNASGQCGPQVKGYSPKSELTWNEAIRLMFTPYPHRHSNERKTT